MEIRNLLYSGKAKSVFTTDQFEYLVLKFRDDISAFDGSQMALLERKGFLNNSINSYFMKFLESEGVETHFVKILSHDSSIVKRLEMIPVECVVRNKAAGSIVKRLGLPSGRSFTKPIFEFFFKNDELHDPLINNSHAEILGWASPNELMSMEEISRKVNSLLISILGQADIILVDFKLEFGRFQNRIILGDEITPDGCRFWDKNTGKSFDKDLFRRGLGNVIESYSQLADRLKIDTLF